MIALVLETTNFHYNTAVTVTGTDHFRHDVLNCATFFSKILIIFLQLLGLFYSLAPELYLGYLNYFALHTIFWLHTRRNLSALYTKGRNGFMNGAQVYRRINANLSKGL